MVEDEELEALIRQREEQGAAVAVTNELGSEIAVVEDARIDDSVAPKPSTFQEVVDNASQAILAQQSVENPDFVQEVGKKLGEAVVENAEAEKQIAGLKKDKAIAGRNRVANDQQRDDNALQVDKWALRESCRQYHFNGVKPIMDFLHIQSPMCLFFLYFILFFTVWFYIARTIAYGLVQTFVDVFILPFARLKYRAMPENQQKSIKENKDNGI